MLSGVLNLRHGWHSVALNNGVNKSNTRIAKWDNLKFLLMMTVVMGYTFDYYTDESIALNWLNFFVYIFHMPAFIFVSGLFMKNTVNNKKYDRMFSYLILGFATKMFKFIANCIVGRKLKIEYFNEDSIAWYAFAVFMFALVTVYLRRFNRTYVFVLAVILGVMVGYDKSVDTYLSLARIFTFYPFFFAGYCLEGEKIIEKTDRIWVKAVSAVFVVTVAVLTYLNFHKIDWLIKIFKGKYPYNKLPDYDDFGGLFRLGHYIVAFAFVFALIALMPKAKTFISTIGGRTLPIYALHTSVITLLRGFGMDSLLIGLFGVNYVYAIPVAAVLILVVTSLKPFAIMIDKIINPPLSAERVDKQ